MAPPAPLGRPLVTMLSVAPTPVLLSTLLWLTDALAELLPKHFFSFTVHFHLLEPSTARC